MEKDGHSIKLDDLLNLNGDDVVKVRFHKYNGEHDPVDLFLDDPEIVNTQWTFWRTKRRFYNVGDTVISLLRLGNDRWLLTTVKRVTKELDVLGGVNYEGEEIPSLSGCFGRLVIRFHKSFQSSCRVFEGIKDGRVVDSMLPSVYDGDGFPGYDKVCLSWAKLKNVIDRNRGDWIAALSNQKAVYVIAGTSNGKLYVGSATAENGMLLDRWRTYVKNGHGENRELKRVIETQGVGHVRQYFQYSILENYNQHVDDSVVLSRESWWKRILDSRAHGYNVN